MLDLYTEQGNSRKDCELKIMKTGKPFHITEVRKIKIGGFLGLFSRPGIEVDFYFTPVPLRNQVWTNAYETGGQNSAAVNNISNLEEEKKKVITAAGKSYDQTLLGAKVQKILDSLEELKEKNKPGGKEEHGAFAEAARLLRHNDFSEKYINIILDRMRKELPLEKLDDPDAVQEQIIEWIGESIIIYNREPNRSKFLILVGPTGVGKTTTIVKLAANYGIGTEEKPAVAVRVITIDAFRIAAREQIEKYCGIMHIPVSYIDNKADLKKEIGLNMEATDLFLIDTIGKSQKDSAMLGEMKELLDVCGRGAEVHLAISAGTKTSDIDEILQQFEPFNYKAVLLTKLDETNHTGNIISALSGRRKSLSYITDGQKVPLNIHKASALRLLLNLDEFKVDSDKFKKRFPQSEDDMLKWS
ncbi:MAG: flagellar biosynthesis protein FlhF [Treponema sp.]|jgi:flagellar biosynthesis protein FlhF|nr:flagellar biosynthesis protein FlhF [Treponema sp.]